MLKQSTFEIIEKLAKKHNLKKVMLFGSCLYKDEDKAADIDLAIEEVPRDQRKKDKESFFNSEGTWHGFKYDIEEEIDKEFDVIPLNPDSPLNLTIMSEGAVIYENEALIHLDKIVIPKITADEKREILKKYIKTVIENREDEIKSLNNFFDKINNPEETEYREAWYFGASFDISRLYYLGIEHLLRSVLLLKGIQVSKGNKKSLKWHSDTLKIARENLLITESEWTILKLLLKHKLRMENTFEVDEYYDFEKKSDCAKIRKLAVKLLEILPDVTKKILLEC